MRYNNQGNSDILESKMKEPDAEYAKVTIIISSPDSNVPTKIRQSRIEDGLKLDELKRIEIKKQSDNIEDSRAKRDRQDNIGLCVVIIVMVSPICFNRHI